jgi:hypothetical protein
MHDVLISLLAGLASTLKTRASLQVDILALRHQLAVLQRVNHKRLPLRTMDRLLWVTLLRLWPDWRKALIRFKPDTVIGWHRRGFRLYWKWQSRRGRIGRPGTAREIRELIRDMSNSNVLWGAPRLHGELLKLGIEVSQATVAKYMVKRPKPPSQTWRTFLENHVAAVCRLLPRLADSSCAREGFSRRKSHRTAGAGLDCRGAQGRRASSSLGAESRLNSRVQQIALLRTYPRARDRS